MTRHDLKAAEWARQAGLSTPNSLYNFVSGRSKTLSQETLEKLASAVPGATVTEIIGESPATGVRAATVQVRVGAGAGMWRQSYETPMEPPVYLALQPGVHADEAVLVLDRHADALYPPGAYVGVHAFASLPRPLRDGDVVLVHRIRAGRHEVTLREIRCPGGDFAQLVFRSSQPELSTTIGMPWPYAGQVWQVDGDTLQVRGRVVIMTVVPFDEG